MSIRICTSEFMLSTVNGMDMSQLWFPRVVASKMLESTKDGEIKRSPDPVTMIEGDIGWYNNSRVESARVAVQVTRAPRTIVAQNPSTVVIHDAVSYDVGKNASADYPSFAQDMFGGRVQIDRQEVEAKKIQFGRFFLDGDVTQSMVAVGIVGPQQGAHFRYLAACQTPGTWTAPSEFDPRWEAHVRWTKLVILASPVVTS